MVSWLAAIAACQVSINYTTSITKQRCLREREEKMEIVWEEKKGKEGERQARPSEETHAREHFNDMVKEGTEKAKADSGAVGLQGNSELDSDQGGKSVSMRLSKTQNISVEL